MENYYIVSKDSELGKAYESWIKTSDKFADLFDEFSKENGIEATQFYTYADVLWIVPTENDLIKFKKDFLQNKIGRFKKYSNLNKTWVKMCKEAKIESAFKPITSCYFNDIMECKSRLFSINDEIYCTLDCPEKNIETPKGLTRIKASDFYKIIEDNNIQL